MADRQHLSQPVLRSVASFFRLMSARDQRAFLFIWDQWIRVIAHLRQHLYETEASASLATILALQKHLNLPFVFDLEDAVYVRGVASGQLARDDFPLPGANRLEWPANHVDQLVVAEGDVLTLVFGAEGNLGDFDITAADASGVTTLQVFNAEPAPLVDYRVDRGALPDPVFIGCAEVYEIPSSIVSIPRLTTTIGPGGRTLVEGADYVIHDGHIGFFNRGPQQHENELSFFFAPEVVEDEELPFQNFGFPIGFKQDSSEEYVRGLQALWFALWNGPTVQNVAVGVSVIFGLPFSTPGTVESISRTEGGGWEVVVVGSERVVHVLPAGFSPNVETGDVVGFQSLTDAARVADYIEEPEFIELFDLEPRVTKFHTFFVVIAFEVLQELQAAGSLIDFGPVVDFVDRIKAVRTDFYLLVEMPIPEVLPVSAETPVVDVTVRAHALLGANPANLTSIDSFGSPGYAHPHGYADHYVERTEMTGTVLTVRDSADELVVSWDEGATKETPEDGVMPGRFVLELANSARISGSVDVSGNSVVLSKGTYDHNKVAVGDVMFLTDAAIEANQEAFTVTEKVVGGLTFTLTFSRSAQVEVGRSFEILRFYDLVSNEGPRLRLVAAQLVLDGLDPDSPGTFKVWRRLIGGRSMYDDYVEEKDTGRKSFAYRAERLPFDFDQDAVQLVDRIKISTIDADDVATEQFNDRDELGSVSGPEMPPTTPPPTTPVPTTPVPTTPGPTTPEPTTQPPTTPPPTTPGPTTQPPTTPTPTTPGPTTPGPTTLPPTTPTPMFELLVEDTFDRASTADIDGSTMSDGVNTWLKTGTGLWGIVGGEANSDGSANAAFYVCDSMADVADCQVIYEQETIQGGVMARWTDNNNHYLCYTALDPVRVQVYKRVSGSYTLLATGTTTITLADIIRFRLEGTSLQVYVNDVLELDLTDSDLASAGKAGIYADPSLVRKVDGFQVVGL